MNREEWWTGGLHGLCEDDESECEAMTGLQAGSEVVGWPPLALCAGQTGFTQIPPHQDIQCRHYNLNKLKADQLNNQLNKIDYFKLF